MFGHSTKTLPTDLSDDECVAFALLHGATFIHGPSLEHWSPELEETFAPWSCFSDDEGAELTWSETEGDTKGDAARSYLRRNGLLPEAT
jgi:hypothetical protein